MSILRKKLMDRQAYLRVYDCVILLRFERVVL